MLSIKFLKTMISGNEFIDFQNSNFYKQMVEVLERHIKTENGVSILQPTCEKELLATIEQYTGFNNFTLDLTHKQNLAVDVGYFSPNHVLNQKNIEDYVNLTDGSLYKWFTQHKEKLFKGTVDYTTGKVTGAFCSIPVTLYINTDLSKTFPEDFVKQTKVSIAGILTGALAHECGHVFGGCALMYTQVSDNVTARAALQAYKNAKRTEDRVYVLKDTASVLEEDPAKLAELQAIAQNPDEGAFILYFNKLIVQRNSRRSLSLGVETMTSEVIADMYAIRMGCDKGITAAVSILVNQGRLQIFMETFMCGVISAVFTSLVMLPTMFVMIVITGPSILIPFLGMAFAVGFIFSYFARGYSGIYNSNHRRLDDIIRQLITKIKVVKGMPTQEKAALITEIDALLELSEKVKPFYADTVVYRTMGWVFNGSDFKKQEIEHYTQVLANHELRLLGHKLNSLKA